MKRVNGVLLEKTKKGYEVSLVINKVGKKPPMLITNSLDKAVNKYIDKCEQYGIPVDKVLIAKLNQS